MAVQLPLLNLALSGLLMCCSAGQLPSGSEERESIIKVFKSNDLNNNKCLSMPEWNRMTEIATDAVRNESSNADQFRDWNLEIFTEIDSDHDKCVSLSEYIEFSKKSRTFGSQTTE